MATIEKAAARRFFCTFSILAFTIINVCPAMAQSNPLFYRSDYPLNYMQLGEEGPLIIADLNNDGRLDIAMGAGLGIAVALGNGDGTFRPFAISVPTGGGVSGAWVLSSAAADFDGDGNIDLVLIPEGGGSGGLIILPGKGDGTFGPGYRIASQGFMPPFFDLQLVAAADLNHDGRLDLVLLTENNGSPVVASAIVFLNGGNGTFTSSTAFSLPASQNFSGEYPVGITIADFNRDGTPDLAVIGQVLSGFGPPPAVVGHLYVALGTGDGSFSAPATAYSFSNQVPDFVATTDFNRDGIPDLAVDTGTTFIFLGNGDGSFREAPTVNLGNVNPGWIVVGDWTGSGKPGFGIFSQITPAGIAIMAGNGDGTFYSAGTAALDIYNGGPTAYASADLNGDGLPDLVAASGGHAVSVFLNAGPSPPLAFIPESAADDITTVAPASLATIYAQFPFTAAASTSAALPIELAAATVNVRDSVGVSRPAPLSYVSGTQINLEIPLGTAPGSASITVLNNDDVFTTGATLVRNVVPAIFTDRTVAFSGGLYPAAYTVTYSADGQPQPPVFVAACTAVAPIICSPVPIPRPAGSRVFLELFATGIRNHVSPVVVSLSSGPSGPGNQPMNVAPSYAGPQGQYDGLDQVNVEITTLPTLLPAPMAPPGTTYTLVLNVDGFISNAVEFAVQ